jgi:hypothetical protein
MASFSINILNDGSGLWTPSVLRNPSAAGSGGTALTFPWVENTLNGASTVTTLLGNAIWTLFNSMFNVLSTTPASQVLPFYLNIIDDGAQNYTISGNYGGTAASGGTALTIPWAENTMNGASTTSLLETAILRVVTDAIVNSNSTTGV